MFDISWGKILIVGIVALVFIKPQDLPDALRTLGQMVGKLRRMASDFQYQFTQAINESGIKDVQSGLDSTTNFNPVSYARDQIKDAIGEFKPVSLNATGPDSQNLTLPEPVIPAQTELPPLDLNPPVEAVEAPVKKRAAKKKETEEL